MGIKKSGMRQKWLAAVFIRVDIVGLTEKVPLGQSLEEDEGVQKSVA